MRLFNRSSRNSSNKTNRTGNVLFKDQSHSANVRNRNNKSSLERRSLRMESLEERQLLSVTPNEYNELRETYTEVSLPANAADVNMIEVTSLTQDSLNAAVIAASQTPENDLIYLRNSGESVRLDSPIVVDLDSDRFGDLTIIGSGDGVQFTTETAVFDVRGGNVRFANLLLSDDSPATAKIILSDGSEVSSELTAATTNFHETINSGGDPNEVLTPNTYEGVDHAVSTTDAAYRWAKTAAQLLWEAGWAQTCGYSSVNEVAEYITGNFAATFMDTTNSSVDDMVEWFLTGDYASISQRYNYSGDAEANLSHSGMHKNNEDGGGYFPELNYDAVGRYVDGTTASMGEADAALEAGTAVAFEMTSLQVDANGGFQYERPNGGPAYSKTKISLTIADIVTAPIRTTTGATSPLGAEDTGRYYAAWLATDNTVNFRFSAELPYVIAWDAGQGQWYFPTEPLIDVNYTNKDGTHNTAWDDAYTALRQTDPVYNAFCNGQLTYIDTGLVDHHRDYDYTVFRDQRRTRIVFEQSGTNRQETGVVTRDADGYITGDSRGFRTYSIDALVYLQNYYTPISPYSISETLNLQSNPDSTNVIYLDFSVMGLDGFSGSVGFQESVYVQQIWQMVAEDFAPFDVNITTSLDVFEAAEEAGEGTVVQVTVGQQLTNGTNYLTAYSSLGQATPLAFYQNAGARSVSGAGMVSKYGAEWASFNAGNQLGLQRDVYNYNSQGDYAPIMSFPATINKTFTQWNNGEYLGSNNTQDDYAVLGATLGFRTDENDGSLANAAALTVVDYGTKYDETRNRYNQVSGTETIGSKNDSTQGTYIAVGVISERTDVDSYSFVSGEGITGGGQYVVNVAGVGADERWIDGDYFWGTDSNYNWDWGYTNLNLLVELVEILDDGTENILVSQAKNPRTAFSHFVTPVLEAGKTYYVRVTNEGQGNALANGFSDYGSLGSYSLKITEYYDNLVGDDNEIVVTTLEDNVAMDNAVSLREATMFMGRRLENGSYVQPTAVFNTSVVSNDSGKVIFDDLSGQTIVLNQKYGEWVLNKHIADRSIVIDAYDSRLTIDASGNSRVLLVDNITTEIIGLTLTGGLATMEVPASLTNDGTDVYNGGGLYNLDGWITIRDCVIAGNAAYESGGGIFNPGGYRQIAQNGGGPLDEYFGLMTIVNSSIVGNTTDYYNKNGDYWLYDASYGGGISNWLSGDLYMVNCTVAGNSAYWSGGGISNLGGNILIDNSVIAENTVRPSNPAKTYGHGADVFWYDDRGTTGGNNSFEVRNSLVGNVSFDATVYGRRYGRMFDGENNIVGTYDAVVDPGFALFRMFDREAGEWTSTFWQDWNLLILGNSPAINSGSNTLWAEYWGNYWDTNIYQSRYDFWYKFYFDEGNLTDEQIKQEVVNQLTIERQEFLDDKLNDSFDLARNDRFNDSIIDMGAYEYVAKADLTPIQPKTTITTVETDWAEPMVVAKETGDRTGFGTYSVGDETIELPDDQSLAFGSDNLYISFSFMNLGRSTSKDVHITLYQIFDDVDGHAAGEKFALLELVVTNPYIPGTAVLDSVIQVNYNGRRLTDVSYNESGEIVYDGDVIGTISYGKNGLIFVEDLWITKLFNDPKMKNSPFAIFPGQYTFRAVLDSTNVIDESDESNNIFSTSINVLEHPGIVVTTELDVVDDQDDLISLREAIQYATAENFEITFADHLLGKTIQIDAETYGRLEINKSVSINGTSIWDAENDRPGITVDGLNASQILYVGPLPGGELPNVSMTAVALTGGTSDSYAGSAIENEANLTLNDVWVLENAGLGAAVSNAATLTVNDSIFQKNVASSRTNPADESVLPALGAALYNTGTLNVSGGRFLQNESENDGGAVYNAEAGTAIFIQTEWIGNVASNGGAIYNAGTAKTINCSLAGNSAENGGALYNAGSFVADNSIFALDFSTDATSTDVFNAETASLRLNFSFVGVLNVELPVENVNHSNAGYSNVPMFVVDPVFDENGVLTNFDSVDLQLHNYSAAVNRGSDELAVDFNGEPLVLDLAENARLIDVVDMGAYELQTIVKPDLSFFDVDEYGEQTVVYDDWAAPVIVVYEGDRENTSYQRDFFYADQDLYINLSMFNIGTAPVMDDFTWQILVDGAVLYEGVYNGHDQQEWILPGDAVAYYGDNSLSIRDLPVGEGHVFSFILDAGNDINELDETNNVFEPVVIDVRELPSVVVTTYDDVVDVYDNKISLREAILYANMTLFTGDVIGNVITFDKATLDAEAAETGVSEFILKQGQLEIAENLTIDGSAFWSEETSEPGVTINGTWTYTETVPAPTEDDPDATTEQKVVVKQRIFSVAATDETGAPISVTLNKLRMINGTPDEKIGLDGGAIYNAATLTVESSVLANNESLRSGGAIYNVGTLSIVDSSLTGNSAQNGGAIFNAASLTVSGTRFDGNAALQNGGSVYNKGTLTVAGSSMTGNSAAIRGGAVYNSNVAEFSDSRFVGGQAIFGGAFFNNGSATIKNSVLEENVATNGGAIYNTLTASFDIFGSRTGKNSAISGGGVLNSGSLTAAGYETTDAEGNSTVILSEFSENVATQTGGAIYNAGSISVADATFSANKAVVPVVEDDEATEPTVYSQGGAIYNKGTISVSVASFLNNSADFGGAIYNIGFANLSQATFNADSAIDGGAIFNQNKLEIVGSRFEKNVASRSGGAIFNAKNLTLSGTSLNENQAESGGAIYNNGALIVDALTETDADGETTLLGGEFVGNQATLGGAIFNAGTSFSVADAKFGDNKAVAPAVVEGEEATFSWGGAVYNLTAATLTNVVFSGNVADFAGAIFNSGTVAANDSTFDLNVAAQNGGAIYNAGTFQSIRSNFNSNKATTGGAVYNVETFVVEGGVWATNSATAGGAIFNKKSVSITEATLNDNAAVEGGAIYNDGVLTLSNVSVRTDVLVSVLGAGIYNNAEASITGGAFVGGTVADATSVSYGNAVYNKGSLTVSGTSFSDGTASLGGGAIYNAGFAEFADASFLNDKAASGGAIYNESGTLTINDSLFQENSAANGGVLYNLATAIVFGSSATLNNATVEGGFAVNYGDLNLSDSELTKNKAATRAGAVMNFGTLAVAKTLLSENVAYQAVAEGEAEVETFGGAIYNISQTIDEESVGGIATIVDCEISLNKATFGGAVYNVGDVEIQGSRVTQNQAKEGGAVYNSGSLTIETSRLNDNQAENGGAINNVGTLTASEVDFMNNVAQDGAAIYNAESANVSIDSSNVQDNNAANAGAIFNLGTLAVRGTSFVGNAANAGAAIFASSNSVVVENATFDSNRATVDGGAVYVAAGTFDARGVQVTGNSAQNGGAFVNLGTLTIGRYIETDEAGNITANVASSFSDNVAVKAGGAIMSVGDLSVSDASFSGNVAQAPIDDEGNQADSYGGAIAFTRTKENVSGILQINSCVFAENAATYGGALYHYGVDSEKASATVSNSSFYANASKCGAAVLTLGTFRAVNCTIAGNSAKALGGGVYNLSSTTLDNTIVALNFAGEDSNSADLYNDATNGAVSATLNYSFVDYLNEGENITIDKTKSNVGYHSVDMFIVDPVFDANGVLTNLDSLNLQLHDYSAAVNRGSNALALDSTGAPLVVDVVGAARFVERVDMGAYELQKIVKPDLAFYGTDENGEETVVYDGWVAPVVVTVDPENVTEQRDYFYVNQELYVNLSMWNNGTAPVMDNFTWTVLLNGNEWKSGVYTGFEQDDWFFPTDVYAMFGETSINIGTLPIGENQTLTFVLDYYNEIDELNEDNNVFTIEGIDIREAPTTIVTTYDDVVDPFDGKISLREAVQYANMTLFTGEIVDNVISFDATALNAEAAETGVAEFVLKSGEINIDKSLTIDGTNLWIGSPEVGTPGATINGTWTYSVEVPAPTEDDPDATTTEEIVQTSRIFSISALDSQGQPVEVLFSKLRLTGGGADETVGGNGGAIYNSGSLTIETAVLNGNKATNFGGAIYNAGSLTLNAVGTSNNEAVVGGGVYNIGKLAVANESFFQSNVAQNGAGLYNLGVATLDGSTFQENAATESGAAVYNRGDLTVENAWFLSNSATDGGALYLAEGTAVLSSANFDKNVATGLGGAVYNAAELNVFASILTENVAQNGGALYNNGNLSFGYGTIVETVDEIETTTYVASKFSNNAATLGGAVYNASVLTVAAGDAETSVYVCEITNNKATRYGGGVYSTGLATLSKTLIQGNVADEKGGGLFNDAGVVSIADSLIDANAAQFGAGLLNYGDNVMILDSVIVSANEATYSAGGIDNFGKLFVKNSRVENNVAAVNGGGIYNNIGYAVSASGTAFVSNVAASGAGMFNSEKATVDVLDDSYFASNKSSQNGGALYNKGTVSLSNATLQFNSSISSGGALYNDKNAVATVDYTTFEENQSNGSGGAIFNNGNVEITDSTFVANTAQLYGGGFANENLGIFRGTSLQFVQNNADMNGGAGYNNGVANVSNSLVVGNTSLNGGGLYNNKTMTVRNTTIGGNGFRVSDGNSVVRAAANYGGGIYNNRTLNLYNSIVAENYAKNGIDVYAADLSSVATNVYYSLIGNASDSGKALIDVEGNLMGTTAAAVDPMYKLGPYSEASEKSGNPAAKGTISTTRRQSLNLRLVSDHSPATNAGFAAYALDANGNVLTVDLDGKPRFDDLAVDMGAYELEFETPSLVVTTSQDIVNKTDGLISLREAILYASTTGETSPVITFDYDAIKANGGSTTDVEGKTVFLFSLTEELVIDLDSTIDLLTVTKGNYSNYRLVLSADGVDSSKTDRVFRIVEGNVTLVGLEMTGGLIQSDVDISEIRPLERISVSGAAVCSSSVGTVTIDGCSIYGNEAVFGGSVFNDYGTMTIVNSSIYENKAVHSGIYNTGSLEIRNSLISGNSSDYYGGAVANYNRLTIVNSVLSGNRSAYGGAVFNMKEFSATNVTIAGNLATVQGGGVWTSGNSSASSVFIANSIIAKNQSVSSPDMYTQSAVAVHYSVVEDVEGVLGLSEGENNLSVDPLFIRFGEYSGWSNQVWRAWNLLISTDSPVCDSGDNMYAIDAGLNFESNDVAGKKRFVNEIIDRGAYEVQINEAPTDVGFAQSITKASEALVGATIGSFSTEDAEGDTHTYSLVAGTGGDDNHFFSISGNQLLAAENLDAGLYSIRVRSTDQNDLFLEKSFVFEIINDSLDPFDVPVITSVAAVQSNVVLTWTCENSEKIKEYRVRYRNVAGEDWTLITKTLTGFAGTVQGDFVAGESYVFQIQSVGNEYFASSDWSEISEPVTIEAIAPTIVAQRIGLPDSPLAMYQVQTNAVVSASLGMIVHWGDGTTSQIDGDSNGNLLHYYRNAGDYCVSIQLIQKSDSAETARSFYLGTHSVSESSALVFAEAMAIPASGSVAVAAEDSVEAAPSVSASNIIVAEQISAASEEPANDLIFDERSFQNDVAIVSEQKASGYSVKFVREAIPQYAAFDDLYNDDALDFADVDWVDDLEIDGDVPNAALDLELLQNLDSLN